MRRGKFSLLSLMLLLALLPTRAVAEEVLTTFRTPLLDAMEQNTVAVTFAPGSSTLSDAAQNGISTLVQSQTETTRFLRVEVAVWSDQAFPSPGTDLVSTAVELAQARAESIVKHLRTLTPYRDIEMLNMAKHENSLARFFSTDAAEVKAAFDSDGRIEPWVRSEAQILRDHGGPGIGLVTLFDPTPPVAH